MMLRLRRTLVRFVMLFSIVFTALLLVIFIIVVTTDPSCLGMTSGSVYCFQASQKFEVPKPKIIVQIETSNEWLL